MGLDEKAPPMNKPKVVTFYDVAGVTYDSTEAGLGGEYVSLDDYDQLKKENEELIYKNWALKNAYDNVDDKNTQLKSLCQRLENVLENVKSKIEYHSQAYALDIMSDDGRKPCTTTAGRMGRHMCKVFSEYLSEALKGEES